MTASIIRIHAILTRHLLLTFRTIDRILNIVYWPAITLVVWGGNLLWMEQQTNNLATTHAVFFSMILWQVVYRVSLEVANCLMEELLSRNLVNLFSTAVSLTEWIIAITLLAIMNMSLIALFGTGLLRYVFGLHISSLGPLLWISLFSLMASGLAIGFLICAIFITWGRAVRDFMHAIVWMVGVFSAMYYPLQVMPKAAQYVASLLPTSYIFESIRITTQSGIIHYDYLLKGLALNAIYLVISLAVFYSAFRRSKQQGLGRLE